MDESRQLLSCLRQPETVLARLPGKTPTWGLFQEPTEIREAHTLSEAAAALAWLDQSLSAGLRVAGFISYEAAPLFDMALSVNKTDTTPLVWLAAYSKAPTQLYPSDFMAASKAAPVYQPAAVPEVSEADYLSAVATLQQHIAEGDIYQANLTFPLRLSPCGDPESLFFAIAARHPVPYLGFVNTGTAKLLSFSPELFLERTGSRLRSRPMKGTARREPGAEADRRAANALSVDPKNRAENVMIVDMVRNDFGRICLTGSIKVSPLFHIETYPSVHQMISEVSGCLRGDVSIPEILRANFPAPSITGAPKVKAMELISSIEPFPRGVYTGTIGVFLSSESFCLNVAIRTIAITGQTVSLGIGSGIVADSVPDDEWSECLVKSSFLRPPPPPFELFETMLWRRRGFHLLTAHLRRLKLSQLYFGRPWRKDSIQALCHTFTPPQAAERARVRLLLDSAGCARMESIPLPSAGWGVKRARLALCARRVDSSDVRLHHKTTNRSFYDKALAAAREAGYDEVIFANERGEITEGAISNLCVRSGDGWVTPPLASGLLPGIWRERQIRRLKAREAALYPNDLLDASRIVIGNSVRGSVHAELTCPNFKFNFPEDGV